MDWFPCFWNEEFKRGGRVVIGGREREGERYARARKGRIVVFEITKV